VRLLTRNGDRIVVEHLEAYQMGVVDACKKRGAIPIGGMNGMVPPRGPHAKASWERIVPAFAQDFNVQVDRGVRRALPHPSPVRRRRRRRSVELKPRVCRAQRRGSSRAVGWPCPSWRP
jgi:hypothetical protein